MKRILCLLLCLCMLFGSVMLLSSCDTPADGQNPDSENPDSGNPEAPDNGGSPDQEEGGEGVASGPKVPQIIFDTDMETDCDDLGALAILCEYHNAGKADLIGVIAGVPSRYAAACSDAVCQYYGIKVPVGTIYHDAYPSAETSRFDSYRSYAGKKTWYNKYLADSIDKDDTDYKQAVTVYRELLASAEDGSVTICVVGFMTAIAELLLSEGDGISPLTGEELVAKKVKCIVSMGHGEKESGNGSFNYQQDAEGARLVFEKCPVPIYLSGAGKDIKVGSTFSSNMPEGHLVRWGYELFLGGKGKKRSSWDLICVVFAVDPENEVFKVTRKGNYYYSKAAKKGGWHQEEGVQDYLVELTVSDSQMASLLEKYVYGQFNAKIQ